MNLTKKIKMAYTYAEISEAELARRLKTSPAAFNQRMKTGKFTSEELENIAKIIGAKFNCNFTFEDGTII